MKDYQSIYKNKLIRIEQAVEKIQSDTDNIIAMCASEPQGVLAKMHLAAPNVKNVNIFACLPLKPYEFFMNPGMRKHFTLCSWFHAPGARCALKEKTGTVTYVPNHLHRAATDRLYVKKPHIFFGTCTPIDSKGFVSLSLSITYEKEIIESADLVILEVNKNLPRTFGDTHLHVEDVSFFVENHQEVPALPVAIPDEIEQKIGEQIATLIDDGSTIQLGIGAIPNACALSLKNKKNLGVHTEMLVDSMVDLYEMGVINNKKKSFMKDKFICTFAMGSKKLYDWLDNNPAVEFRRGKWVNDPCTIRNNSQMVSINTCIAVDLTGQVASESIGPVQYSGTGGQTDTAVGAREGLDGLGKSIIACRSTAKDGELSTIVTAHTLGTAITLHRSNTDFIVTEHGIASLRGKTVEERALALINIAHPKFREELTKQARDLGYLLKD